MGKLKALIQRFLFSEGFSHDLRMLNVVGVVGIGVAFIAMVIRLILGAGLIMPLVMLGMIASLGALIFVGNRFQKTKAGILIALILLGNVLFPIAFFVLGGAKGSMASFFVVSLVTVFMLLQGKAFVILLVLHIVVIIACYFVGFRYPALPFSLSPYQQFIDTVQAIIVGGMYAGFAIKFQNRIYRLEKQRGAETARELVKQDELLRTINDTAAILLTVDKERFESALQMSMEMMARCVEVDHIYIWKNHEKAQGLYYARVAAWETEIALPGGEIYARLDLSYDKTLPLWEEHLFSGQCVNGPIHSLSPAEQECLAPFGIKSILAIPVFLQERFWGFVSFDDCRRERKFPAEEENILRSGTLLMVNAVVRNEMTQSLILAREEALSSTKAKSDFLANMSHEMRTPMNAITGMTAIAQSSNDMDRKNYCLNKISDASSHLLGVINDILDMSKIEANKFELSPVNFNFEKMLQKVVNVVNFKIDEKKQNFLVNIDPKIPRFLISDDQRLAQVITNLLSNALKFTPEHGAIRLNTKFLREESEYCTIQFEVIDSGIGITEEQKPRLFNSFEQAESGTSRKFGGTGLGLAISKRIVEMMNGRIWVESAWGEGSSFSFTIQAKRGEESPGRRLNPGVNLNTLRILVADDDPEVREYLAHLMEQFRISCDIAAGAEEALALVEKNGPYDMYLVDWKMPGMNGIDLSRKIKKQGSGTSIIIMISATELRDIEDDAKDAGVDRFLAKPIFPSMILDAINECLGTESLLDSGNSTMEVTDNFEGRRILLVEDVEINREIVQTLLEPTLLQIDCAENGRMAVEMFRAAPEAYDMIFMDVQMPEMDGYEATRKIRQFEKARNAPGVFPQQGEESERLSESPQGEKSMEFLETPKRLWESPQGIPIIAMTANVFQEDIQKCLQAGMNGHVGKPIDFSDVLAKLRTYLPPKET